jgi:hypothetical protein
VTRGTRGQTARLGPGHGAIAVLSRATESHLKWRDPLRHRHDNRGTRALNQSLHLGLLRSENESLTSEAAYFGARGIAAYCASRPAKCIQATAMSRKPRLCPSLSVSSAQRMHSSA